MKQQTSVDWLIQNIEALGDAGYAPEEAVKILGKKARTMNKDEIMEAYDKGSDVDDDLQRLYGTPEEYYNKKFGQGSPDTSSPNIKNK